MTRLDGYKIVVTAAGRDFGRSLAIGLAERGAELFLSARDVAAAERTRAETGHPDRVHAFGCDLSRPDTIAGFAEAVAQRTDHVDVLINNGARYLDGPELTSASDADIAETIASGATGTVLAAKHFLPLLRRSQRPDIVTMVSACADPGHDRSLAHPAFYAAKSAQAGFTEILSRRLRPEGVRVMSLYPPDFDNPDRLSPEWEATPRTAADPLTAQSLIDCVLFAIGQPRDCFLRSLHFEQVQ